MLAFLLMGQTPDRVSSLTGEIRQHLAFESKILGNKRNISVYLPPDYDKTRDRYPVLYMGDGQNCFDGATSYIPNQEWRADETAESLIRGKFVRPFIIVAIDNAQADRANEYLPTKSQGYGGRASDYGKFLVTEVKPFVDRTYRTKTGPRDTALAGSSFGGIITSYLGLEYPGVFGRLGIFSPSVWFDNRVILKMVAAKAKPGQRIYIDIGTKEGPFSTVEARQLRDAYAKAGYQLGRDLSYFEDAGAEHNERAWDHRFPSFVMWIWK
jgi:hypothetical protein